MSVGAPTIGELTYSEQFGGFAMWPDQLHWSFQFIRLVAMAPVGGGDFTEVYHATRGLAADDVDGFHRELGALARRLEDRAERSFAGGHRISARDQWLRASNYYRAAGFFFDPPDPRNLDTADARIRCFQAYARLADTPIVPVEVPYEHGQTLPGYLCWPRDDVAKPLPGAVVFGGGDSITEETWLHIGKALVDRGFVVLLVDGPGMGEALRRGIYGRHDWEVPASAAYEHLVAQPSVDPERIAVIAESWGGYYAARAGAMEPRFAASVIWGGFYHFPVSWVIPDDDGRLPANGRPARRIMSVLGVSDPAEARELLAKHDLDCVLEHMRGAALVVQGGAEAGFHDDPDEDTKDPAARILAEIPHDDKELLQYPLGTPGCAHCTLDSIVQAHEDIGNWLEDRFAR